MNASLFPSSLRARAWGPNTVPLATVLPSNRRRRQSLCSVLYIARELAGGGAAVEATPTEGEDQPCYRAVVLPVAGEREREGGVRTQSFAKVFAPRAHAMPIS